jgi:hypothetical protein
MHAFVLKAKKVALEQLRGVYFNNINTFITTSLRHGPVTQVCYI